MAPKIATDVLSRNNVTLTGKLEAPKTLVFVHGFGTDQTAWSDVVAAFQEDYRIVLLDNVGAGKSDSLAYEKHNSRYVTLEGYADDLVEIGIALQLKDAVLVGHSVGAMIALLAANRRRDMFSKLVLLAASPRYLDDDGYHGGFTEKMVSSIHLEMYRKYHGWARSYAQAAMDAPGQPELVDYFANSLTSIPLERAASVLITILQSDHRSDVPRVTVPTLIVQSREDSAVPLAVAEFLHEHIQQSRLAVIDATGHLPHISAPGKVVGALKEFDL